MPIDEVTQMRVDAQDALDALGAERGIDDEVIRKAHSRVLQLAHTLSRKAEDPITIGIVGEFSVGKSMLLGTLLGRPALLPVEERATTGNVTALTLRPGDPGEPTVVEGAATVQFLSEHDLTECVGFMCGQLIAKARASKFPPDVTTLEGGYNPVTDGWEKLEGWCRRYLWPEGGGYGSLEPRQIAAELMAVRDAHLSVLSAPDFLGGRVTAGASVVSAALDLRPSEITPDEFPARHPRLGLDLNNVGYDETALAKVFPLIYRVSYLVRVDPLAWPLDSLRGSDGNSIVILDFPGLAAGRSDTRDKFLSQHHLDDVHTIITVFKADRSDTEVPRQFFTMLESHGHRPEQVRDYIIAVGNAFDLITPPVIIDDQVTLDGLQQASQQFRSLWVATSNLTQRREDRVRAVSSVAAIARYGYPIDDFSDEQKARLKEITPGVAERQAEWGRIGKRLAVENPDATPWGETLVAFGEDGGIASLRELIESHVAEHGLVNKIDTLRMKRTELVSALTQFAVLLPDERVDGDETAAARLRVDQVCDEFRLRTAQVIESANYFRDPLRLKHAEVGVIEAARLRCMADVMAWPEWAALLHRAKDGKIAKRAAGGSSYTDDPFGEWAESGDGTIDTTQIFFEHFCTSFGNVLSSARMAMKAAVAQWIADRNDALGGLRGTLTDPQLVELFGTGGSRLAAAGRGNPNRIGPLRLLADLSWAARTLTGVVDAGAVTQQSIAPSFPMPLPRYLPWHRSVPEKQGEEEQELVRHQMYVFRMRREIAAAMADGVAAQLAQDIGEFHRRLLSSLHRGETLIPDPGTVRMMFPDPPKEEHPQEDAAGSPVRALLRKWRARDARPVL